MPGTVPPSTEEEDSEAYTTVPADPEITIRHLLNHTSGLSYGNGPHAKIYEEAGLQEITSRPGATIGEAVRKLAALLPIKPFTAEGAARVWKMGVGEAEAVLDELAGRAILLDIEVDGSRTFALPPDGALHVLDYERASHVVESASHIGVGVCYCRHKMEHMGRACASAAACAWPPARRTISR